MTHQNHLTGIMVSNGRYINMDETLSFTYKAAARRQDLKDLVNG